MMTEENAGCMLVAWAVSLGSISSVAWSLSVCLISQDVCNCNARTKLDRSLCGCLSILQAYVLYVLSLATWHWEQADPDSRNV
jgi:hypothetical protein